MLSPYCYKYFFQSIIEIKKKEQNGVGLLVRFFQRFSQEYVTGKEGLDRAMARYVKVYDKIVEAVLKLEKPTITNCSMFHNDLARQLGHETLIPHEFVEEFGVLAFARHCLMVKSPNTRISGDCFTIFHSDGAVNIRIPTLVVICCVMRRSGIYMRAARNRLRQSFRHYLDTLLSCTSCCLEETATPL